MYKIIIDKKLNDKIARYLFLKSPFFVFFIIACCVCLILDVYCLSVGLLFDNSMLSHAYRAIGFTFLFAFIILIKWIIYKKKCNDIFISQSKNNVLEYNCEQEDSKIILYADNGNVYNYLLTDISTIYETKEFVMIIL